MFTVVKLAGCNGSGKSTLARKLLDITDAEMRSMEIPDYQITGDVCFNATREVIYYEGHYYNYPFLILGKYLTACGGMDTISDKQHRMDMLLKLCKRKDSPIIFFEGLITGKTYGAFGELSEQHVAKGKGRWLYTFMDTPFEVCTDRVLARRLAKGNTADFDPERTMRSTFKSCESLLAKISQTAPPDKRLHPHPYHIVDHKHSPTKAANALLRKILELHNG